MDSTERILMALGEIKGELGEARAEGRGRDRQLQEMKDLLADHVVADNKVASRVTVIEHAASRMKGMLFVVGGAAGLAASIGVAVAKAIL